MTPPEPEVAAGVTISAGVTPAEDATQFGRWVLASCRDHLVLVLDPEVAPLGGVVMEDGVPVAEPADGHAGSDIAVINFVKAHPQAWNRWLVGEQKIRGPAEEGTLSPAEMAEIEGNDAPLEERLVELMGRVGFEVDKRTPDGKSLREAAKKHCERRNVNTVKQAYYELVNDTNSPAFKGRFKPDNKKISKEDRRKFWSCMQPKTTVFLPKAYTGLMFMRRPAHSGGREGQVEDEFQISADGQVVGVNRKDLDVEGLRVVSPLVELPTNDMCVDAAVAADKVTTTVAAPGWFSKDKWLLRWAAPVGAADPDGPIVRGPRLTGVLEIMHTSELSANSAAQLTLSASGGCVMNARNSGDPIQISAVPKADVHALVALPPVGGGSWQLRTLARFQAFEVLRSLLCVSVSPRVTRAVMDTLKEEAAAAETKYARWADGRSLIAQLVEMEAPQEVVRGVVTIGGAAVPMGSTLLAYLTELRSPCTCSDWCINVVKDEARRHNLVLYHAQTHVHIALHPDSDGMVSMHSPTVNATDISADGLMAHAPSAVLFCRFRKLVCRTQLPEGRYDFGAWTIVCHPKLFTCLEVVHKELGNTRFRISMSQVGSATHTSVLGRGKLLSGSNGPS